MMTGMSVRVEPSRGGVRATWPAALIAFATLGCLLDGFTTWVALAGSAGQHQEHSEAVAAPIRQFGLVGGIALSILLRVAIFAALAVAIERVARGRLALVAIGLVAAAVTWLIVLGNIASIAGS
jgi:hypothetical protein